MKSRVDRIARELKPDWPQRAIQFDLVAAQADPAAFVEWLEECRSLGVVVVPIGLRGIDADGYAWTLGSPAREGEPVTVAGHQFTRGGKARWTVRHYPDMTPQEVLYDRDSFVRFMAAEWAPQGGSDGE